MNDTAGRPGVPHRGLLAIVVATATLGVLAAVAITLGTAPAERTFVAVSGPSQSLMSVTAPFLGVLLVGQLGRPIHPATLISTVGRALGLGALVAVFGVVVCAAATAVVPSAAGAGRWESAGSVALGSLLVQGVAQLVGTGLGLVIRRPALACLATVVLPLGLWWLLGAVKMLRPAQAWVTPYPSVQRLLSAGMSPTAWAQWLTVLAIWGVGLNTFGTLRGGRSQLATQTRATSELPEAK